MTVKTTGAEWLEFYYDKNIWNDIACHEDEILIVDGKEYLNDDFPDISPTSTVKLIGGLFYSQGDFDRDSAQNLETVFRKWKKLRDYESILVKVKKGDAVTEFQQIAKEKGWVIQ